ncbi:MAG: FMN-binding protein [Anaerolineae bacterium]|nr:FMN-binding protein [Anaerolineae bacterium]
MKVQHKKNWKIGAVGASLVVASAMVANMGVSAQKEDAVQQTSTPTATATATATAARPPFGGRPGGRGGRGEHGGELQGLDTNPPAVELAPTQSGEATQSTEKVEGADFYDGQYYGDAVSAGRWGTMQVVAVIENGKLTDVLIASYPHSTYESDIITRNALPTLISEAIKAQDSEIDLVSRATDSSRAFVSSLKSALLDAAIGMDL